MAENNKATLEAHWFPTKKVTIDPTNNNSNTDDISIRIKLLNDKQIRNKGNHTQYKGKQIQARVSVVHFSALSPKRQTEFGKSKY